MRIAFQWGLNLDIFTNLEQCPRIKSRLLSENVLWNQVLLVKTRKRKGDYSALVIIIISVYLEKLGVSNQTLNLHIKIATEGNYQ